MSTDYKRKFNSDQSIDSSKKELDIFMVNDNSCEMKTYTELVNNIPSDHLKEKMDGWRKKKLTEWRWRFFMFADVRFVEISFLKYDEDYRSYLSNKNNFIKKKEDKNFPENLIDIYYYYCN